MPCDASGSFEQFWFDSHSVSWKTGSFELFSSVYWFSRNDRTAVPNFGAVQSGTVQMNRFIHHSFIGFFVAFAGFTCFFVITEQQS